MEGEKKSVKELIEERIKKKEEKVGK